MSPIRNLNGLKVILPFQIAITVQLNKQTPHNFGTEEIRNEIRQHNREACFAFLYLEKAFI